METTMFRVARIRPAGFTVAAGVRAALPAAAADALASQDDSAWSRPIT